MTTFQQPTNILSQQSKFSGRDVGITHPDNSSFIRIASNGNIFIMSQDNLGIIINSAQQSITLVGDTVKFLTNDDEGLLWNKLAFNSKASKYSEPTFIFPKQQQSSLYAGVDHFVGD